MSTPTNGPFATPETPSTPDWLVTDAFTDTDLGVLLSGKEAQISLLRRRDAAGLECLLVRKHYIPRKASTKGELEALGLQKASTFRNDSGYREGRQFRRSRDRRAVAAMTGQGKRLLQSRWSDHESTVLRTLWDAGLAVPLPVSFAEDSLIMQYLGDEHWAAPQLARAGLDRPDLERAATHVIHGLQLMLSEGWVHGDLSAFNLLWWEDQAWFIDFPQAIDLAANPQGPNYLHRDILNVATWFERRGVAFDGEAVFAEMLGLLG